MGKRAYVVARARHCSVGVVTGQTNLCDTGSRCDSVTVLRQCFNLTLILVRSLTSSRWSSNFDFFNFLFHFLFRLIFTCLCLVLAVFRTNPSGRQHACMASHMSQLYTDGRSLILLSRFTKTRWNKHNTEHYCKKTSESWKCDQGKHLGIFMNFPDSGCYRMERAWCTDFRAKSLALRRMQKVPGRPFCVSTLSLVLLRFRRDKQKSKGRPLKM